MPRHPLHPRTTPRQDHRQRWPSPGRVGVVLVATLLGALVPSRPVPAAEFACAAGDVACLIDAINMANANGEANTITLEAGTYTLTAVDNTTDGPNGLPSVTSPLTIRGAEADATILERAAGAPRFRLVHVAASGNLTLVGLVLRGGGHPSLVFGGGGLFNNGGTVFITRTTFTENSTNFAGGGLLNEGGTVVITDTTFTRNNGGRNGGGLANLSFRPTPAGTVVITNTTVANNAANEGGGLLNSGATLLLTNTTITRNFATVGGGLSTGFGFSSLTETPGSAVLLNTLLALNAAIRRDDCMGPVTSLGTNLIGDPSDCTITLLASDRTGDPGVGEFTDDGTPGRGHFPLLEGSPAIDAGNDAVCPRRDQLGQPRVGVCDIGAIEFQREKY